MEELRRLVKKFVLLLSASVCLPTLAAAQSLDLLPIGKNFGHDGTWQIALDKSYTGSVCVFYDAAVGDRAFLVGVCRTS